ncbi:MAG: nickel insertion protein [Christensenellaceae bacterium]
MRKDKACEISTNIDDMTGEEIGFLLNLVMEKGALDAWATPIFMKKQRPAYMVSVLCKNNNAAMVCDLIFKHSSSIGLRIEVKDRIVLERDEIHIDTSFGMVCIKRCGEKKHIEYEDLARIAKEKNLSIAQIKEKILGEIDI